MAWQERFEIVGFIPWDWESGRPYPFLRTTKFFVVCSRREGVPFGMYDTHKAAAAAAEEIAAHWSS
jgi:hypothetical protein